MNKRTEQAGKRAASVLEGELDANINNKRALVDVQVLEDLLAYVKELQEPPVKVTKDIYLRGEWYVDILKTELTEGEVELLRSLSKRTAAAVNTIEIEDHNPDYPLPNWLGHHRVG